MDMRSRNQTCETGMMKDNTNKKKNPPNNLFSTG